MSEPDDRLVGDPVWELFPDPSPGHEARRSRRYLSWLAVAILIVVAWFLYPPLSVIVACLAVAARDFQTGRRLARSIPDKAGGGNLRVVQLCLGSLEARDHRLRPDIRHHHCPDACREGKSTAPGVHGRRHCSGSGDSSRRRC